MDATAQHRQLLEIIGRQFKDPEQFRARIEEIYASSPPESFDLLELADGRVFERFSKIQFVEERNVGRVWSFRDITERKRAEEELRQQREWFQVTLSSIGDAVITTDTEGKVTFLNPVAEMMTGWTSHEASGQPLEQVFTIINEDSRQPAKNPVAKVLQQGTVIGLANHTALISKTGTERSIEDSAAPIRDASGEISGAVMVFHDVTERRRTEKELKEADKRKDEFLATLAHELRNPLHPIRGAVEIMRLQDPLHPEIELSRNIIDQQVTHLSRLIDDLLDVARITRDALVLRKEKLDLANVIQSALDASRDFMELHGHQPILTLPPESVEIDGDLVRLTQILVNLLSNAAKYTPKGKNIWLNAGVEHGAVVISVKDSGIGIAADQLPHVFDKFYQVDRSLERSESGLGLGLTLARRLVELHGGEVNASSAGLGMGSEFSISLPLVPRTDHPQAAQPSEAEREAPAARWRILIIDDGPGTREMYTMLLRKRGHEVDTAVDGWSGIEKVQSFRPDIVLLDVGMPGLNGFDTCEQIRALTLGKDIALIAVTGWAPEEVQQRAEEAGFDGILVKPASAQEILQLIASLLAGKTTPRLRD